VPWVAITELEQVCSSIYADENNIDAKIFAINRVRFSFTPERNFISFVGQISAWRSITSLPHAVESTLALLTVIVHDAEKQGLYPQLLLRQSYATAILRLVNGLVDPLQVGTYARSIATIAQQLGLPNWLVELRHAATHEDLPSIDLLREGARQVRQESFALQASRINVFTNSQWHGCFITITSQPSIHHLSPKNLTLPNSVLCYPYSSFIKKP